MGGAVALADAHPQPQWPLLLCGLIAKVMGVAVSRGNTAFSTCLAGCSCVLVLPVPASHATLGVTGPASEAALLEHATGGAGMRAQ